jgi:hypothetical protein
LSFIIRGEENVKEDKKSGYHSADSFAVVYSAGVSHHRDRPDKKQVHRIFRYYECHQDQLRQRL